MEAKTKHLLLKAIFSLGLDLQPGQLNCITENGTFDAKRIFHMLRVGLDYLGLAFESPRPMFLQNEIAP